MDWLFFGQIHQDDRQKKSMSEEEVFTPACVIPNSNPMTPVLAFTIWKERSMTTALQAKSDLFGALGCDSTDDFVWLQKEDLDDIRTNGEADLKFKPLEVRYLLALITWIWEFKTGLVWTKLALQDFSTWRNNSASGTPVSLVPSFATPATPSTPSASSSSPDKELDNFSKSIKRSVGDYTELSNDKHFHQWYASTIVTARVHELRDVINPACVPTPAMYEVFQEKIIFFYSIHQKTLVMSRTKVHIRMYAKTSDGQKVFAALVLDFTTGLKGNLRVDSLKINLNDFKSDSSWDSTCFDFIAAWKHKLFDL
jgi:hypothetical protein